jgi:nicotinamide riboside kinase
MISPDCDAVQDGTRQFLDKRIEHYNEIKEELVKRNCNFVEIGGDWNNRFEKSKNLIEDLIYK